jgi:hypothetical protein
MNSLGLGRSFGGATKNQTANHQTTHTHTRTHTQHENAPVGEQGVDGRLLHSQEDGGGTQVFLHLGPHRGVRAVGEDAPALATDRCVCVCVCVCVCDRVKKRRVCDGSAVTPSLPLFSPHTLTHTHRRLHQDAVALLAQRLHVARGQGRAPLPLELVAATAAGRSGVGGAAPFPEQGEGVGLPVLLVMMKGVGRGQSVGVMVLGGITTPPTHTHMQRVLTTLTLSLDDDDDDDAIPRRPPPTSSSHNEEEEDGAPRQ